MFGKIWSLKKWLQRSCCLIFQWHRKEYQRRWKIYKTKWLVKSNKSFAKLSSTFTINFLVIYNSILSCIIFLCIILFHEIIFVKTFVTDNPWFKLSVIHKCFILWSIYSLKFPVILNSSFVIDPFAELSLYSQLFSYMNDSSLNFLVIHNSFLSRKTHLLNFWVILNSFLSWWEYPLFKLFPCPQLFSFMIDMVKISVILHSFL